MPEGRNKTEKAEVRRHLARDIQFRFRSNPVKGALDGKQSPNPSVMEIVKQT